MTPDELFDSVLEHPRVVRWKALLSCDYPFADLRIDRRWNGLVFSPVRMIVVFRASHKGPVVCDDLLWEDDLNDALVEMGARAKNHATEVVRYVLSLGAAFYSASMKSNRLPSHQRSVLVDTLRNGVLAEHAELRSMLDKIAATPQSRDWTYDQTVTLVDDVIRAKARELAGKLGYDRATAVDILSRSLAQYLGETFRVT